MPLKITDRLGAFDAGTPLLVGYWPRTGKGDPRVEGYNLSGIDLMFQWNWVRARALAHDPEVTHDPELRLGLLRGVRRHDHRAVAPRLERLRLEAAC